MALEKLGSLMRISLIGSGRVATHLARVLKQQHEIVQVYSRHLEHAAKLANQCGAKAVSEYQQLNAEVDLVIIAVSDQVISSVIVQLSSVLKNVLIVHTSGSTHLSIIADQHLRSGVFYPLQTFSLERIVDWADTPLFVEAVDSEDLEILKKLAESLSKRVYVYDSEQRLSLHLAAVFACNFSNYCYDMAKQVVDAKHVDFSLLYPLMFETAKKAIEHDPRVVQTGPAMRGDQNILNMHQQMLEKAGRKDLGVVYKMMSDGIRNIQPE